MAKYIAIEGLPGAQSSEDYISMWPSNQAKTMSAKLAIQLGRDWLPDTAGSDDRCMPGVKHVDGLKEISIIQYPSGLYYLARMAMSNDLFKDGCCSGATCPFEAIRNVTEFREKLITSRRSK